MKATLEIDFGALADNYRMLRKRCPEECGATVKADAYGLGVHSVVRMLIEAGCERFFVATLSEGIALRKYFRDINIYVFSGLGDDDEKRYKEHNLQPVSFPLKVGPCDMLITKHFGEWIDGPAPVFGRRRIESAASN